MYVCKCMYVFFFFSLSHTLSFVCGAPCVIGVVAASVGLDEDTELMEVWNLSKLEDTPSDALTKHEFMTACKYVALCQEGVALEAASLVKKTMIPHFGPDIPPKRPDQRLSIGGAAGGPRRASVGTRQHVSAVEMCVARVFCKCVALCVGHVCCSCVGHVFCPVCGSCVVFECVVCVWDIYPVCIASHV